MIEPVDGVEIDVEARQIRVLGITIPVAFLDRMRATEAETPAMKRARLAAGDPVATFLHEKVSERWARRITPSMPESIHFNVPCGENGWWIEVAIYPEDREMTASPCGGLLAYEPEVSATELLDLWRETARRQDAPALDEYDVLCAGCEPGTWIWPED